MQTITKSRILTTIILMDLLTGMEFDLFVPSFPEMQQYFHLTPFWVEALLSVNFAGYCVSLFFVGALADHYGRRPIILAGLVTFIFGSLLCLARLPFAFLLLGRFLQGVGIAAPSILSFLIIADIYPLKQQQSLFALLNGLMNATLAFAPVLGSYITLWFHWQGNFMTLLLLSLLTLGLTLMFIPDHIHSKEKETISIHGYFSLFRSKPLVLLTSHFVFQFVPYWIFVGISPLLFMESFGVNLSAFGYYQGSLAFIFGVGSIFFGFFVSQFDQKKMLFCSAYLFVLSIMILGWTTLQNSANPLAIVVSIIPFVIAQIIPVALLYPLCLNFIPHAKGRVAAILQGSRLIFSALSLQIAGYFYNGSFQNVGILMNAFILLATITLFYVLQNQKLMKIYEEQPSRSHE